MIVRDRCEGPLIPSIRKSGGAPIGRLVSSLSLAGGQAGNVTATAARPEGRMIVLLACRSTLLNFFFER